MSVWDVPALQRPALASKAVGVLPVPLQPGHSLDTHPLPPPPTPLSCICGHGLSQQLQQHMHVETHAGPPQHTHTAWVHRQASWCLQTGTMSVTGG